VAAPPSYLPQTGTLHGFMPPFVLEVVTQRELLALMDTIGYTNEAREREYSQVSDQIRGVYTSWLDTMRAQRNALEDKVNNLEKRLRETCDFLQKPVPVIGNDEKSSDQQANNLSTRLACVTRQLSTLEEEAAADDVHHAATSLRSLMATWDKLGDAHDPLLTSLPLSQLEAMLPVIQERATAANQQLVVRTRLVREKLAEIATMLHHLQQPDDDHPLDTLAIAGDVNPLNSLHHIIIQLADVDFIVIGRDGRCAC
jgi:hypothetical protein